MTAIRKATAGDLPGMMSLINELALYEKAPHEVEVSQEQFEEHFREKIFEALVACDDDEISGMALYYIAYSTWKGKIIYLDDLVVTEKSRRSGIGKLLFDALIIEADARDAAQLRWHVLEWNDPAINFYRKYNAGLDPEWITGKLTRKQLTHLAGKA